jgi:plastocyanin
MTPTTIVVAPDPPTDRPRFRWSVVAQTPVDAECDRHEPTDRLGSRLGRVGRRRLEPVPGRTAGQGHHQGSFLQSMRRSRRRIVSTTGRPVPPFHHPPEDCPRRFKSSSPHGSPELSAERIKSPSSNRHSVPTAVARIQAIHNVSGAPMSLRLGRSSVPAAERVPSSPGRRSQPRRRLLTASLVVVAVAGLTLSACGGGGDENEGAKAPTQANSGAVSGNGSAVDIANFEFKPQKLTVRAGTTVTWTNQDTAIHSIKDTSPLATPVSKDLGKGDTFSITYDKPGSYSYICGIHNYMTGSVDVTG